MALAVIVVLYISIGLMAAAGTIAIVRKLLPMRAEQIFYGLFLVLIAAFYLAFTAYFDNPRAWPLEAVAVALFTLFGVLGCRIPAWLIAGYLLHGVWDLFHELPVYTTVEIGTDRLTEIPMAYGVFCIAYDWCMAAYIYVRRRAWRTVGL
ncbi:hypothetical protein SAMN04487965_3250 [Microbulbifer donghaiensis]|uniref:Uncharacterized protein n=1 Tax=Microbulbifer donghaiensis TaxID=494016 RepID=A0A1M5GTL1_9GAMM|nr:DUF6010 family protein [Microbulbifer donghaiensis]SHG07007.1 hypothetical protein SAMN04487965_3250 [Microbulbifer donghaiensis]